MSARRSPVTNEREYKASANSEERNPLLKRPPEQDIDGSIQSSTQNRQMGTEGVSLYRMSKRKKIVVFCVCLTEFFERLAFYGVYTNLVLYCTIYLDMNCTEATKVSYVFSGVVYVLTLFGGLVADLRPGKYWTIIISGVIYLLGLTLLTATVKQYTQWLHSVEAGYIIFSSSLLLVALGSGGMRANLGPFGAQQVVEEYGSYTVRSFFTWFYWGINGGALVANTVVVYVQQYQGFQWGYLIVLVGMVVGIIVFVFPRNLYERRGKENILSKTFLVCRRSCGGCKRLSFDEVKVSHGGQVEDDLVDGVVGLIRILPILAFFIIYFTIYSQIHTSFFLQSERLNMSINGVEFPVSTLTVFDNVIILLFIPIMDCAVYPFFKKLGYLRRIGLGFFVATLSVVAAGILEIFRRQEIKDSGGFSQLVVDTTFNASHITVFAQVPQFALVGISEVLCVVSGFEFAYMQAPVYMQGFVTGLFLLALGVGSFVSLTIVSMVTLHTDWYPAEINTGGMEYLFFLMAGIAGCNFVLYSIVAYFYKTRTHTEISRRLATA